MKCWRTSLSNGACFFLLASLLGSLPVSAQSVEFKPISMQELSLLLQTSQSLRLKLQLSTDSLKDSKQTVTDLQSQLETLSKQVYDLGIRLTQASDTSMELEQTLTDLKQSFTTYKNEVQSTIRKLEGEKILWGLGGAALGALALEILHWTGVMK